MRTKSDGFDQGDVESGMDLEGYGSYSLATEGLMIFLIL